MGTWDHTLWLLSKPDAVVIQCQNLWTYRTYRQLRDTPPRHPDSSKKTRLDDAQPPKTWYKMVGLRQMSMRAHLSQE